MIRSFSYISPGQELAADYFLSYFEIAPKIDREIKMLKEREAFRKKIQSQLFPD